MMMQARSQAPKQILTDEIRAKWYHRYIDTSYKSIAYEDGSYSIFVPMVVGKTYRLYWDTTDSSQVSTIYRYGMTDTLPPQTGGAQITLIAPHYRGTPQAMQEVEIAATGKYLTVQVGGSTALRNLSHFFIYEL